MKAARAMLSVRENGNDFKILPIVTVKKKGSINEKPL